MRNEISPMPDDVRAFLSEAPAGTYDKPVTANELCDWIGGDVSQIEALVRDGVVKPNEAGLFPLMPSVQATIAFWEAAAAMGGPVRGEA
jgi:hypothetical protein